MASMNSDSHISSLRRSLVLSRDEQETQDRLQLLSRPIRDVDDEFLKEVYNVICGTSPLPVQGFDHWDGRNATSTPVSEKHTPQHGIDGDMGAPSSTYFNLFDPEAFIQKQSFLIQYHRPSARLLRSEGASFLPHALSTTVASCHPVAALSKLTPKQLLLPAQLAIAPPLRHSSQHAVGDYSSKASAHSPTVAAGGADDGSGDGDESGLSVEEWRHLCISATNPIAVVGGMLFHNDTKSFLFQQAPFVYSGSRKHKCLLQDVDVHFIETAALQLIKIETIIGSDEEEEGGGGERGSMSKEAPHPRANNNSGARQRGHSTTSQQQHASSYNASHNRSLSKSCSISGTTAVGRDGSIVVERGYDVDDVVDQHSVPDHILQRLARENAVASAKQASKRDLYCGEKLRAELRKKENAQSAQLREMSRTSTLGRQSQTSKPRHTQLLPTPPPMNATSKPHLITGATAAKTAAAKSGSGEATTSAVHRPVPYRKYASIRNVAALTSIPSPSTTSTTEVVENRGRSGAGSVSTPTSEDGHSSPPSDLLDAACTIAHPIPPPQQQLPPAHLRYKKKGSRIDHVGGDVVTVGSRIEDAGKVGGGHYGEITLHPHTPTTPTDDRATPSSIMSRPTTNDSNSKPTATTSVIKSGVISFRRMPPTSTTSSPLQHEGVNDHVDSSYGGVSLPSAHTSTTVTATRYNARVLFQIEEFEAVITSSTSDTDMGGVTKTPWVVQTIRLLRQGSHAAALHGRQQFTATAKQNDDNQPPLVDCVGPVFVRAFAPSDEVDAVDQAPSSLPASSTRTTPANSLSPLRDNRLPLPLHPHQHQHQQLPAVPSASALLGSGGGVGQKGRLMLSTMRNPVSGEEALKTCNTTLYHWCLQRDPKELGVAATVIKNTLKYFKHTFNVVRTVKRLTTAIRVMQRFVRKFLAARTRAINYMLPLWEVAEHRCAERLLKSTQHMDTTVSASVFTVIANHAAKLNQHQHTTSPQGSGGGSFSPTTSADNSKRGSTAAVVSGATTTHSPAGLSTLSSAPLLNQRPNPPHLPPGAHRPGAMLRYAFLAPAASDYLAKAELEITAAAPNTIAGRRDASLQIAALHDNIMRDSKVDAVDLLVRSAITKRLVTPTPFKIALLRMLWAKRRRLCSALLLHFNTVVAQKNDAIKLLRNNRKSSAGSRTLTHTRGSGTPMDVAAVQAAHAVLSARDPVETIPASLWAQIQRSGAAGGYLLVNIKKGLQVKSALKDISGGAAGGGTPTLFLPAIHPRGAGAISTGGAGGISPSSIGGRGVGDKKRDAPLVQETKEERVLGRSEWAQGGKEESAPLFGFSAKVFQTLQSDARHEVGILNERQSAAVEWLSVNFVAPSVASPPRIANRGSRGVSFSHDHSLPSTPTTTPATTTSILATLSEPHDSDSDIERLLHQVQAKIATFRDFYTAAELQRAKLIVMASHQESMMMGAGSPQRSQGQSAVRSIRTEHKGFNNDETLVGLFLSHCREQRVVEASPLPRRRRNSSAVALITADGGPGSPTIHRFNRHVVGKSVGKRQEGPLSDGSGPLSSPQPQSPEEEVSNTMSPTSGSPFAFSWYFNVNDLVREAMSFISSDLAENERTNGIEGRHRDEDFGEEVDDDGDDHDSGPSKSRSTTFLARVEEKERAEVRYALNGGRKGRRQGGKSTSSGSILRHPMVSALIATLPPQVEQQPSTKRGKK